MGLSSTLFMMTMNQNDHLAQLMLRLICSRVLIRPLLTAALQGLTSVSTSTYDIAGDI